MDQLNDLINRIIRRVNVNLSEFDFDSRNFVYHALELEKMLTFHANYGITSRHPIYFHFKDSNIAGSYFLGKCYVGRSAVYKSDVRGDELKRKGDTIRDVENLELVEDEIIKIKDSLLYKTLVHSNSRNTENPEEFRIRNTVSGHYSNIHGASMEGCFLGPFATVDIVNLHSCIVGKFSYVQTDELFHRSIDPGTIWVRNQNFEFKYKYAKDILQEFLRLNDEAQPAGLMYDFVKTREPEFEQLFEKMNHKPIKVPSSSSVNQFAVVKGKNKIGENVLVSQKAYLENAVMGDGSNAQENTYIINSTLAGNCITAHGGKVICADIGTDTFVGFNCFLNGSKKARISIGEGCIVMPHTIIAPKESIEIPEAHLVWGIIRTAKDLKEQTIDLDDLADVRDSLEMGRMKFTGKGSVFIEGFRRRLDHILLENGAYFSNGKKRGHAQDGQDISFNIIQAYRTGQRRGLYPSIRIKP